MSGWGKDLALTWTNVVPPSRPSIKELNVYRKVLDKIRANNKKTIKMLVLGSTPEFRDWGYEENLEITVVDKSIEYYQTISREIKHKNLKEKLVITQWEDMCFHDEFDLIIGDLAVGNIDKNRLKEFVHALFSALTPGGYCIGKSFFWTDSDTILTPKQIISEYYKCEQIHPYTFINHHLCLYCLDKKTCEVNFSKMYNEMVNLLDTGLIDRHTFSYFENVGWNTDMVFNFYTPKRDYFIDVVNKELTFICYIDTLEIYSKGFPIYIIRKD